MTKIKQYRLENNLSQSELAELVGVSKSAISLLESRGGIKNVKTAFKYATILNINPADLLEER